MRKGFTIVELLVVVGVLGILAAGVLGVLNPVEQAKKGRDTQRKHDLTQIRAALENYYTDNNRYPASTADFQIQSGNWGKSWQPYMAKVPQDQLANKTYVYISDGISYQLYAYLERQEKDPQSCKDGCGPNGEYFYGLTSANVAVAKILLTPTSTPTGGPASPTSTGGPASPTLGGPTPTSIPVPIPCGGQPATYFISHNDTPQFMRVDLAPELPCVGQTQTAVVQVRDKTSTPITDVTATVITDRQSITYPLSLTSGTNLNGSWTGSWVMIDTIANIFEIKFEATNQSGKTSSTRVILN